MKASSSRVRWRQKAKKEKRWYAAHLVQYAKALEGGQDRFPVWENILLIAATDVEEVFETALELGPELYAGSGEWIFEGQKMDWVFAGVRKVVECLEPLGRGPSHPAEIRSGVEATYYQFIIEDEEDLGRFLQDKPVRLICEQNPVDDEDS